MLNFIERKLGTAAKTETVSALSAAKSRTKESSGPSAATCTPSGTDATATPLDGLNQNAQQGFGGEFMDGSSTVR